MSRKPITGQVRAGSWYFVAHLEARCGGSHVTVCIAARSMGMLVLASDRMLTAGDIQFEPPTEKITLLTSSIATMVSGDSSFYTEIITEVFRVMSERMKAEPNNWWAVKDVVDLYISFRNEAKRKRAQAAILAPLGLDSASFLANQKSMDSGLVDAIARDLISFEVPTISTIFAGIDHDSNGIHPHIYTVYDGDMRCDDVVGFSAVGSGSHHAEAFFMLSRHSWKSPIPETLLLTYSAKKNSEVAPGVGKETDMFVIGPGLGQAISLSAEIISKLDGEYRKAKERERKAQRKANEEVKRYVEELGKEAATPQDQPPRPEAGEAVTEGATS
jgi:hypothetical protein